MRECTCQQLENATVRGPAISSQQLIASGTTAQASRHPHPRISHSPLLKSDRVSPSAVSELASDGRCGASIALDTLVVAQMPAPAAGAGRAGGPPTGTVAYGQGGKAV